MMYYGNNFGYPQQQQQQQYMDVNGYAPPVYPSTYTTGQPGLASYGQQTSGNNQAYRVNLPAYYAGPSYSTTSDNDFNFGQMPYPNQPTVGYTSNNYPGFTSYPYSNDPYGYQQPQQLQQQQPAALLLPPQQQQQSYSTAPQQQQQQQQPQSAAQSFSQSAPGAQDDISELAPQIEAAYEAATGQRRQPVIKRQVITLPGTPGRVQQVVRRLPTPTPDIVERVFIVKPQRDVVNLMIERPSTPPAQYKDRTVVGKPRRPLINPRIVRVPPRIGQYSGPQYQQYVHALPAPAPQLNVQTVRVPFGQQNMMASSSQPQTPQPTQPALSHVSQGQMSQVQLSQSSQTQMQQQQPFMAKGYLIGPVQYDNDYANYATSGYQQQPFSGYPAGYQAQPSYFPAAGYPAYTRAY